MRPLDQLVQGASFQVKLPFGPCVLVSVQDRQMRFPAKVAFSPWMWAVTCRMFCRCTVVAPEASVELLQSFHRVEIAPKTWAMERRVAAFAPLAHPVLVSARLVVFMDLLLLLRNSVSYG